MISPGGLHPLGRGLESSEDGSGVRRGGGDVFIVGTRITGSQVSVELFYGFRHSG